MIINKAIAVILMIYGVVSIMDLMEKSQALDVGTTALYAIFIVAGIVLFFKGRKIDFNNKKENK
jgi:multisubunit Na+/H+ antiporter MnhG subunit